MIRPICNLLVFGAALVSILTIAGAQENQIKKTQVKPTSSVSGAQMFKQYCAVCHGPSGKGDGPVATALKVPPPDLTTLAQRHDGKFPDDYVSNVLKNGVQNPAHGSGEMPVWGPIFDTMNRWKALCPGMDETPVTLRITNLTNYLKSIQKK
ncbi:MAG: c-type cytochrome [Candidatus Sulfotelmatobacter sp.]